MTSSLPGHGEGASGEPCGARLDGSDAQIHGRRILRGSLRSYLRVTDEGCGVWIIPGSVLRPAGMTTET